MSSRKRKRNISICPSSQKISKKNDCNSNQYNMKEKTYFGEKGRPRKETVETHVGKGNVKSPKNTVSKSQICRAFDAKVENFNDSLTRLQAENEIKGVSVVLTRIDDSMYVFPSSPCIETLKSESNRTNTISHMSSKNSPQSRKNPKPDMHHKVRTPSDQNCSTPNRMKKTNSFVLKTQSATTVKFSGQMIQTPSYDTRSKGTVCNKSMTSCDLQNKGPSSNDVNSVWNMRSKSDSPTKRRSIKAESQKSSTTKNPRKKTTPDKKSSMTMSPSNKSCVQINSPLPKMKKLSIMCEKLLVDNTGAFTKDLSDNGSGISSKKNQETSSPAKPTPLKHEVEPAVKPSLIQVKSSTENLTSEPKFIIQTRQSKLSIEQKILNSKTSDSEDLQSDLDPAKISSEITKIYLEPRRGKNRGTSLKQPTTAVKVGLSRPKMTLRTRENGDQMKSTVRDKLDTNHLLSMVKTVTTTSKVKSNPKTSKISSRQTKYQQTVYGVLIEDSGNLSGSPNEMVKNHDGDSSVNMVKNHDGGVSRVKNDDDGVNPVNMVNYDDDSASPVNMVNNDDDGASLVNIVENADDGVSLVNMVNDDDGVSLVNMVNNDDDGVCPVNMVKNDDSVKLVNMVNNDDDDVSQVTIVKNDDVGVRLVNIVNNDDDGVSPVMAKNEDGVSLINMMNNGDDDVVLANMVNNGDDDGLVNMVINNGDVTLVADDSSVFSNEEFLASLPAIEDDTTISKELCNNTEMSPNHLNMPVSLNEDLQISKIEETVLFTQEMVSVSIGTTINVSSSNQEIISGTHKEAIDLVSSLNPENLSSISGVSHIDTQDITPVDITKKQDLYGQSSETTPQSTIMQNDLLESTASLINDSVYVDMVPNEPNNVVKDSNTIFENNENKSDEKTWLEHASILESLPPSSELSIPIDLQNVEVKHSETLTETQGHETMNSLDTKKESEEYFQAIKTSCKKGNPQPKSKNIVKIKVAFASAKSVLEQIKTNKASSFIQANPDDGIASIDRLNEKTMMMSNEQEKLMEQQGTVIEKPKSDCDATVYEESKTLPKPVDSPWNTTENCFTTNEGASSSADRNYSAATETGSTCLENGSSENETGRSSTCTDNQSPETEKEVDSSKIVVDETPIAQGRIPDRKPPIMMQVQGRQNDVTKYQNILTPEVLKQILSLNSSVGNKQRKPQMLKLPNGSIIKLNFSKVNEEANSTNRKSSTITNDPSSKAVSKRKRIRTPKFPPGWVCPFEPPQGEKIATYQNREEMNNLIVKCSSCNYYHCPLCEFQRFKPQPTKERVFQHIDLIHWSRGVPVIIDEKEYFTVICNLLHGKKVYKKSHLHCPCGLLVRYHDKRERFQYHRKYICPMTAHIRQKKGIFIRKKRTPNCLKTGFPENQHRSIHDSWEDMLSCVKKCSLCDRYHCFVCPETKFLPAGRSRLVKHLKSHYNKRTQILTSEGESGPFILACKLKHADVTKRHYHCLCGQILKTTIGTFRDHIKNCRIVTDGLKDKGNYTQMNIYEYEDTPLDQQATLSTIQLRMMIPRNTVPLYGPNGEKVLPPSLRSGIFRNIQELCSVAKRCYTCCTQYHCPLCPPNTFRPSNRTKLASHLLRTHHKFKLPLPSGLFSYPCSLSHNGVQQRHYHCACDYLPAVRLRFLKHVSFCDKAVLPLVTPQLEEFRTIILDKMNQSQVNEIQDIGANIISERGDINPLNQIFENSDDEDEDGDDDILSLEKKLSQTLYNDHAYLHNKEDLVETLEDHLEAKSAVSEIAEQLPEVHVDNKDKNASVEPVDTMLRSQEWFATSHEITNTCMSDPSRGLFNPFDLVAAQVKKCEDCCKNYHCPYCPPMYFKPNSRNAVIRHMKTHWAKRVILIDGTFALPCFFNHYQMLNMHYHCLCGAIVESNSSFFYSHIKECQFIIGMAEDCQSGIQPLCQQIGVSTEGDLSDAGFQSLDKVVTELSSLLEENKKQAKKSAARNSSSKAGTPDSRKSGHRKTNSQKHAKTLKPKGMETEAQIHETIANISCGQVEQRVIADVIGNYVEDDWMITANNSADVSTNTTHVSPEFSPALDEVQNQGLEVPSTSNVTLQYEGMNYDIVVPYHGGVLDMNTLQEILPPGYSYMVID